MNKTIHELDSLTQAQADDEFIIYDVSEGKSKKIQVQNLTNPNYSTEEVWTGGYWKDGKKIYRKVVDCGALPNTTTKNVAHNIANISWIVNYSGVTSNGSEWVCLPASFTSSSIGLSVNSTNIILLTYSNRTSYTSTFVTIEYTKTTDQKFAQKENRVYT